MVDVQVQVSNHPTLDRVRVCRCPGRACVFVPANMDGAEVARQARRMLTDEERACARDRYAGRAPGEHARLEHSTPPAQDCPLLAP